MNKSVSKIPSSTFRWYTFWNSFDVSESICIKWLWRFFSSLPLSLAGLQGNFPKVHKDHKHKERERKSLRNGFLKRGRELSARKKLPCKITALGKKVRAQLFYTFSSSLRLPLLAFASFLVLPLSFSQLFFLLAAFYSSFFWSWVLHSPLLLLLLARVESSPEAEAEAAL